MATLRKDKQFKNRCAFIDNICLADEYTQELINSAEFQSCGDLTDESYSRLTKRLNRALNRCYEIEIPSNNLNAICSHLLIENAINVLPFIDELYKQCNEYYSYLGVKYKRGTKKLTPYLNLLNMILRCANTFLDKDLVYRIWEHSTNEKVSLLKLKNELFYLPYGAITEKIRSIVLDTISNIEMKGGNR
jgi:hypothetical protein